MASVDIMSILQSSYSAASQQSLIPVGAKFAGARKSVEKEGLFNRKQTDRGGFFPI